MNKARITYRFDQGQNQAAPIKEHMSDQTKLYTKGNVVPLDDSEYTITEEFEKSQHIKPQHDVDDAHFINQFTTDFGAWQSPFEIETEKLENLIRETDNSSRQHHDRNTDHRNSTHHHSEQHSSSPYDQQPTEIFRNDTFRTSYSGPEIAPEVDMMSRPRYVKRSSRTPWMKMFFSFSGAVITGAVLGFFVLSLFSDSDNAFDSIIDPYAYSDIENENEMTGQEEIVIDEETSGQEQIGSGADDAVTVNLPTQNYYFIQHGVFSTAESAEQAIQSLERSGFATSLVEEEHYTVFAGIVGNRDDALALSYLLEEQDFETYIDSFEIPAVQSVSWSGTEVGVLQSYFKISNDLISTLSGLSFLHLQNDTPKMLSQSSFDAVKTLHQDWTQQANQIGNHMTEEQQLILQKMNQEMNTAIANLEEYKKNPSNSYQWQIQSSSMEFMVQQKQLLQLLQR